jgi:serine/threonine protein kinase
MGDTSFSSFGWFRKRKDDTPRSIAFDNGLTLRVDETRQGGMGDVLIGRVDGLSERIAAKRFREELTLNVTARIAFENEANIWMRLAEVPFVLPLLAVTTSEKRLYLLTPFAEPDADGDSSLRDALRRHGPRGLGAEAGFVVAFTVSTAMTYAAKLVTGLVHGDIKPENILFLNSIPHIADFGLASSSDRFSTHMTIAGTTDYLAPECRKTSRHTVASDIYAFGVTLYECLTGTLSTPVTLENQAPDDLLSELLQLANRCRRELPAQRPENFRAIELDVLRIGMQHTPQLCMHFISLASRRLELTDDLSRFATIDRLETMLNLGDVAQVLQELEKIPAENRSADLWLLAGTANSLWGQDQVALQCFDACLAMTPGDSVAMRCQSERGLSLRRLDRYVEAEALFSSLLPHVPKESHATVALNHALTLIDLERYDEAATRATVLCRQYDKLSMAWQVLGLAQRGQQKPELAVKSFMRAVSLDPGNAQTHIELADLYAHAGNLSQALKHLDAAYDQGEHSHNLFTRLVAVNTLLGRMDDVDALLTLLKQGPDGIAEAVETDAFDYVKLLAEKLASPTPDKAAAEGEAEATGSTKLVVLETAIVLRENQTLPMIGCRAYLNAGLYTFDYYDEGSASEVAARFGEAFLLFSRDTVNNWGVLTLRNSMFGFAHCTKCDFRILTNRTEDELLLCRMCDQKGPLIFDNPADDEVAHCEQQAGLNREAVGGMLTFFSAWPLDSERKTLEATCHALGWSLTEPKMPAAVLTKHLAMTRGLDVGSADQMLFELRLPPGEQRYADTSLSAQRLLIAMRENGIEGPTVSVVADAFEEQLRTGYDSIRSQLGQDDQPLPTDPSDLALLIGVAIADGRLDYASALVSFSEQITGNEHPELIEARALYALRCHDYQRAKDLYNHAKALRPLDTMPRIGLIEVLEALGDANGAQEERNGLRAIGLRFPF